MSSALVGGAALALALLGAALIPRLAEPPPPVAPTASSGAQPASAEAPRTAATSPQPAARAPSAQALRRAMEAMRERLLDAIRARSADAPSASTPEDEAATETLPVTYEPRRILEELGRATLPVARRCYEAALARRPDLAGHLVLLIEIEGDPAGGDFIRRADFTDESALDDPALKSCVRDALLALTFDAHLTGAGRVTLKYPIELTPESE